MVASLARTRIAPPATSFPFMNFRLVITTPAAFTLKIPDIPFPSRVAPVLDVIVSFLFTLTNDVLSLAAYLPDSTIVSPSFDLSMHVFMSLNVCPSGVLS